jgi:hypothetical protein
MNLLSERLEEALAAAKQQTLSNFTRELIVMLMQYGYQVEDLISAITDYVDQNPSWIDATKYLEDAGEAITSTRKDKPKL